jgi:sulfite reductase alpha subunit-like flavoprotein
MKPTKKEDERCCQCDWAKNATHSLGAIDLVKDFRRSDTLRLESRLGQVLLFLCQPARRLWSISEREKRYERNSASDDALDCKDHSPGVQ